MLSPFIKILSYLLILVILVFVLIIKAPNLTKKYEGYIHMSGKTETIGKGYHGLGKRLKNSAKIEDIGGGVQDSINTKAVQ